MRAIAYIRVSDTRQVTEGDSLRSQETLARSHISAKGYEQDRIFVERGESAKTDQRTALKEMIDYCRRNKGRIDVLVIPKIDRLARYSYDYANIKVQLARCGVRIESIGEKIDDSPVGRFTEGVLASVAQFDNEVRAERCKGGMIDAVLAGRWVWKAPIGFRNTRVNGKGTIEPDPATAPIIVECFERVASGQESFEDVRRWLAATGIEISRAYFGKMLSNKAYIGVIEAFGKRVAGCHPFIQIVEPDVFYRVQGMLPQNEAGKRQYRFHNAEFPLRGVLRCSCGKALTACWSRGQTKRFAYYRCMQCVSVNLSREEVQEGFRVFLNRRTVLLTDKRVQEFIEFVLARSFKLQESQIVALRSRENRIEELAKIQAALAVKNACGVIPDDVARREIDKIAVEIARTRAEMNKLRQKSDRDLEAQLMQSASSLRNLGNWWTAASPDEKRRLQTFLFPKGVELTKIRGFRTLGNDLLERLKEVILTRATTVVDQRNEITNFDDSIVSEIIELGKLLADVAYDPDPQR